MTPLDLLVLVIGIIIPALALAGFWFAAGVAYEQAVNGRRPVPDAAAEMMRAPIGVAVVLGTMTFYTLGAGTAYAQIPRRCLFCTDTGFNHLLWVASIAYVMSVTAFVVGIVGGGTLRRNRWPRPAIAITVSTAVALMLFGQSIDHTYALVVGLLGAVSAGGMTFWNAQHGSENAEPLKNEHAETVA